MGSLSAAHPQHPEHSEAVPRPAVVADDDDALGRAEAGGDDQGAAALLDYEHLLFALDHPACVLKGVQSLRFIVSVAQELSGKPIPEDLVYQPWKNPDKQITFLTFLLESPEDLVDFAASPNQIVRVEERGHL